MSENEFAAESVKVRIYNLSWLVIPFALIAMLDWIYRDFGPEIADPDYNILAFEAVLFVFTAGYIAFGRRGRFAGLTFPKGFSWLWLAGPLWLGVIGPIPQALEALSAAPEKALLWGAIALLVAYNEEVIFRGLMLRGLLRSLRPMAAFILSSIAFGCLHLFNLNDGGQPVFVLAQVFAAFGVGSVFAVMTLRSGSVLPAMLFHFLGDTIGLAATGGFGAALQQVEMAPSLVISGLIFFGWGLFWMWRTIRADKVII